MRRIHIIGRKNSGKTTLVTALIAHFTAQGLRVGSIKHTHHRHELDIPGKDSFKHREAGAAPVAILSPGMSALFRPNPSGRAQDGYAWVEASMAECDLVLVEGDSLTAAPKVEVWRAETQSPPMVGDDPTIRALITDDPLQVSFPIWPRSNIETIAANILRILKT